MPRRRRLVPSSTAPATASASQSARVAAFHGSSTRADGAQRTKCSDPIATTWKSGGVAYS